MKTLKIKEQMIFFSYLKKNAGWLCLDWAAQCFQKKKMFHSLLAAPFVFWIGVGHWKGSLLVSLGTPCHLWTNFQKISKGRSFKVNEIFNDKIRKNLIEKITNNWKVMIKCLIKERFIFFVNRIYIWLLFDFI